MNTMDRKLRTSSTTFMAATPHSSAHLQSAVSTIPRSMVPWTASIENPSSPTTVNPSESLVGKRLLLSSAGISHYQTQSTTYFILLDKCSRLPLSIHSRDRPRWRGRMNSSGRRMILELFEFQGLPFSSLSALFVRKSGTRFNAESSAPKEWIFCTISICSLNPTPGWS